MTPYDGKLNWWHFRTNYVAYEYQTPAALAREVRKRTPDATGIVAKVAHGATWEGKFGNNSRRPLDLCWTGDVTNWVAALADVGLELHLWAVPTSDNPQREAEVHAQAASVPGVKSLILDVEPYEGFWRGAAHDVATYTGVLRDNLPDGFHVGISVDSRSQSKLAQIQFRRWLAAPVIQSVHPQVYWHDFGTSVAHALAECMLPFRELGLHAATIFPVFGTYPNRHRQPVLPAALQDAVARGRGGYNGCSLFRLGDQGWAQNLCDAVQAGWLEKEVTP